jgi:hypothetical protein
VSLEWLGRDQIPDRPARRRQVVLTEFQLGQVPAFRQVFVDHFGVTGRVLPEEPGWFRGPSGGLYEMVLTARSGQQVPVGVEVAALPERFVPLADTVVNRDLWEFLRWVVERTGEPWTLQALGRLAALYRIPGGQPAADR